MEAEITNFVTNISGYMTICFAVLLISSFWMMIDEVDMARNIMSFCVWFYIWSTEARGYSSVLSIFSGTGSIILNILLLGFTVIVLLADIITIFEKCTLFKY